LKTTRPAGIGDPAFSCGWRPGETGEHLAQSVPEPQASALTPDQPVLWSSPRFASFSIKQHALLALYCGMLNRPGAVNLPAVSSVLRERS